MSSLNETSPEKSIWGYKGVIAGFLFFGLFLVALIASLSSEPEYMPSQQLKRKLEAEAIAKAEQAKQTPPATSQQAQASSTDNTTTLSDKPTAPSDVQKVQQ